MGLAAGCKAVEADIWLREGELLVGHDWKSLRPERNLKDLYLEPLQAILEGKTHQHHVRGRVYEEQQDSTPFVLMLDFKSQGPDTPDTLKALEQAITPLRRAGFLSYGRENGPVEKAVTIVASGDVPFDLLTSEDYNVFRDIFFDAPLQWIWEHYTSRPPHGREPGRGQGRAGTADLESPAIFDFTNSYLASVSFKSLYWPPLFGLSPRQKRELAEQIEAAHNKGLKARYWGTWDWVLQVPARRKLWRQLTDLGVDFINVDAIEDFTEGNWRNA